MRNLQRPNVFIVGAPKCATTSLANALTLHPQVFVPFIKEPSFFGSDIGCEVPDEEAYLALYRNMPPGTQVAIDATTLYLYSEDAVCQIMEFDPRARIVCVFRDPLEAAPAYHSQLRRHFVEPLDSFDQAWEDQPARRTRAAAGAPREPLYRDFFLYGRQLERLYRHVPSDQVCVMLFRDLVRDPTTSLTALQRFLGLDPMELSLPHANESGDVALEGVYRMKVRVSRHGREIKRRLGIHRNLGVLRFLFRPASRPAAVAAPNPETIRSMMATFETDVALFEKLTGKNLRGPLWQNQQRGIGASALTNAQNA